MENQEHLMKTVGPMYLEQQVKEGKVTIVNQDGKPV
jgi:hypothetical protein